MDKEEWQATAHRLLEAVGLFAQAEVFAESIVTTAYLNQVPRSIRDQVVKPRWSTSERERCLAALLTERGIDGGYPTLVALFHSVAERRNYVAHGIIQPGDDGTGLFLQHRKRQSEPWTAEQVDKFREDAVELSSLLFTLMIELDQVTGLIPEGRTEPPTGMDVLNNPAPNEIRPRVVMHSPYFRWTPRQQED